MKKLISYLGLLLALSTNLRAAVRTLCNMPYTPGQFTTFNAAESASSNNDTIYVHGSTTNYGPINITRQGLVVIGTGHNPVKQSPLISSFTTVFVNAANVQLIGLTFDNVDCFVFGLAVKRCKILSTTLNGISGSGTDWTIEGNVFIGSTITNISLNGSSNNNTSISNNVFNGTIFALGSSTTAGTFEIFNNIFLGNNFITFQVVNAVINNNIFYRSSPQGTTTGCTMNNNISFSCSNNNFSAAGINNLVNVNPQFTSFPLPGANFDYSHNYALLPSSPGRLSGSDGTDRGVFGGPGAKFSMTGEPGIAEITSFSITSPTSIAPGGTLNISITSKRVR